ncbi:MAG: YDG domain-containing protein [Oscillospiraceae bacterium]
MKTFLKKAVSLALVLALLMSLVTVSTFASTAPSVTFRTAQTTVSAADGVYSLDMYVDCDNSAYVLTAIAVIISYDSSIITPCLGSSGYTSYTPADNATSKAVFENASTAIWKTSTTRTAFKVDRMSTDGIAVSASSTTPVIRFFFKCPNTGTMNSKTFRIEYSYDTGSFLDSWDLPDTDSAGVQLTVQQYDVFDGLVADTDVTYQYAGRDTATVGYETLTSSEASLTYTGSTIKAPLDTPSVALSKVTGGSGGLSIAVTDGTNSASDVASYSVQLYESDGTTKHGDAIPVSASTKTATVAEGNTSSTVTYDTTYKASVKAIVSSVGSAIYTDSAESAVTSTAVAAGKADQVTTTAAILDASGNAISTTPEVDAQLLSSSAAATYTLTAKAYDQYGDELGTQPTFAWTVTVKPTDAADPGLSGGVLTFALGAKLGTYTITATAGSISDTQDVTLVDSSASSRAVSVVGKTATNGVYDTYYPASKSAGGSDITAGTNNQTETILAVPDSWNNTDSTWTATWYTSEIDAKADTDGTTTLPTGISLSETPASSSDPVGYTKTLTLTNEITAGGWLRVAVTNLSYSDISEYVILHVQKAASEATYVAIDQASSTIDVTASNQTNDLTASVYDQYGAAISGNITWSGSFTATAGQASEMPDIASTSTNSFTIPAGAKAGTYTMTATSESLTDSVTFTIARAAAEVTGIAIYDVDDDAVTAANVIIPASGTNTYTYSAKIFDQFGIVMTAEAYTLAWNTETTGVTFDYANNPSATATATITIGTTGVADNTQTLTATSTTGSKTETLTVTLVDLDITWPAANTVEFASDPVYGITYGELVTNLGTLSYSAKVGLTSVPGALTVKNAGSVAPAGTASVTFVFTPDSGTAYADSSFESTGYTSPEVAQKVLTVTGLTATDREYDGTVNVDVTGTVVLNGILSGDEGYVTGSVPTGCTVESADISEGKLVTFGTGVILSGDKASNYTVTQPSLTVDITAKAVVVTGIKAQNETYNGTTAAILDYEDVIFTGMADGDTLSVTATGTFTSKSVGEGKQVDISAITLVGDDAANYSVSGDSQTTTTATITAKEVTVGGIAASEKTYDGTTAATLVYTGVTFTDMITDDVLTVTAEGAFTSKNAGDTVIVNISNITLGGADAENYTVSGSSQTETTASITKATATITIAPITIKYGNANSALITKIGTVTATGVSVSDTPETIEGTLAVSAGTDISTYAVSATAVSIPVTFTHVDGNYVTPVTGTVMVTFTDLDPQVVTFESATQAKTYGDAKFTVTAANSSEGGGDITYSSGNEAVATVNATTGEVTIHAAGTAVITATAARVEGVWAATPTSYTLTVSPKSISGVTIVIPDGTYTGSAVTPAITSVTDSALSAILAEDTDYNTAPVYANNINVAYSGDTVIASATVTITGKGNYTGTAVQTFAIDPKDISTSGDVVISAIANQTYTGSAIVPTVIVTDGTRKAMLSSTTDYTASASDNTNVGTATFTATGKGNYTGALDKTFTIVPKTIEGTVGVSASTDSIEIGTELTANISNITSGATVSYQWYNGTTAIEGATSAAYTVPDSTAAGTQISVAVTGTGNFTGTLTSGKAVVGYTMLTGTPEIDITTDVNSDTKADSGDTLTADMSDLPGTAVAGTDYDIVWYRSGTQVGTGATYTLTDADKGCEITISAVAKGATYTGSVSSAAVSVTATVPSAPVVTASKSNSQITFRWTATDGGRPISRYTLQLDDGDAFDLPADTTSYKFTGLTNGTSYMLTVTASNEIGTSEPGTCSAKPTKPSSHGDVPVVTTTYTITATAGAGGTIDPEGATVEKGDDQTFTITADTGYEIKYVLVDGLTVGAVDSYTFEDVTAYHTIKAVFSKVEAVNQFTDVESGDWFSEAVNYVFDNGLMNGMTDTEFAPATKMNRAMLVTVLWRIAGEKSGTSDQAFGDIPSGAYYEEAVRFAVENGITAGRGDGNFDPNADVTREEMALFFYRFAQYMGYDVSAGADISGYSDASDISSWAGDAMAWANSVGLITGRTDTELAPAGDATRAEIATIIMRFVQYCQAQ